MMHYCIFAIVDDPTETALTAAMAPFSSGNEREGTDTRWDWYVPGGRYDGYLLGAPEMERRETHNGFNFDKRNRTVEANFCRTTAVDRLRLPYGFVVDGVWQDRQEWDGENFTDVPDFEAKYLEALNTHPNAWVIVVDVHN
jgi:hypothetical protein